MASFWFQRGYREILAVYFRGQAAEVNLYLALITSAITPDPDMDTFAELTEIAAGNGYTTGGFQLTPNSTDFDTLSVSDSGDYVVLQLKDITWTASGGPLPSSGSGARYAILMTDEGTIANRQLIACFDLGSAQTRSDGNPLTLQNLTLKLKKPA